ncbi:hypothetical protein chmu144 [Choristoneura murinana nucleopolyhedrovirus]|uniref:Uncharacterized protein n=1 Tax=Choristoneura murinana nucleopolyhedrovirus TaxID=1987479 RepID=V9XTP0_9ABAC|nr:hypothetical protein chmu144 [Choristoneura murinana nucleopolyhedrovirus]AHD25630.1 hypothetical protein chmu144 [Choristoneura murinana nucleopolyhedrovirus]
MLPRGALSRSAMILLMHNGMLMRAVSTFMRLRDPSAHSLKHTLRLLRCGKRRVVCAFGLGAVSSASRRMPDMRINSPRSNTVYGVSSSTPTKSLGSIKYVSAFFTLAAPAAGFHTCSMFTLYRRSSSSAGQPPQV